MDSIIYKGEQYGLAGEPFESYLAKRPDIQYHSVCSACWRGYSASWEVIEDKLYLIDLKESFNVGTSFSFIDISPNLEKVLADWYSGILIIPYGELIQYKHGGYLSKYENEFILEVEKGIIISERIVDNRKVLFDKLPKITKISIKIRQFFNGYSLKNK